MKKLFAALAVSILVLAGCGGGGGGGDPTTTTSGSSGSSSSPSGPSGPSGGTTPVANTVPVVVDKHFGVVNVPYVSVTVCQPGTAQCATIDHVLLDTGSVGLRVLSSALQAGGITLPQAIDPNTSNPLAECEEFGSGFTWGSVAKADVQLAGEKASSVPVQIVNSSFSTIPAACASYGADMGVSGTASMYANGILGVNVLREDCGVGCETVNATDLYYACASGVCNQTPTALADQVHNPAIYFGTDNNGVVLNFPAVPQGGSATVTGTLTFGINTQSDNQQSASALVLSTDNVGVLNAKYNAVQMVSFIDSGSSVQFIPDNTIAQCGNSFSTSPYFCSPTQLLLPATMMGSQGQSGATTFTIGNAQTELTANPSYAAFFDTGVDQDLFGIPVLDLGMPYFYGRTIYFGFQGNDSINFGQWPYNAIAN